MVYVDKVCLNKELVKLGLAWHYKQYNSDPEFSQLESEARALRIGLWSHPNPVEPWNYRHNK
jgi:endonuclease YncB( thermonuclease family)